MKRQIIILFLVTISMLSFAQVTVTVTPANPFICPGNSVLLTASGALTYSWAPATGLSSITGASVYASPSTTTTYTVTGTDGTGGTGSTSVTVNVGTNPVISVTPPAPIICSGASVSLTANSSNPGTNFTWSPATGLSSTTGATVTANPATTTTYTVNGTDGNGCTGSTSVTVNVAPNPTVSISASANPICMGASTTLTAGGATTYSWSGGLGTANPVTVSPASTTTYTVTGTTAGCTGTASITVTVNIISAMAVATNENCGQSNGTATVTATGNCPSGFNYQWNTTPTQVTSTATNLPAGNYTVTVFCGSCTTTASVVIANILGPSVAIINFINASCGQANGSASALTIGGSAPYTFQWNSSPPQFSQNLQNVPAGTYTIIVTDANGCTATNSVTISETPDISALINNVTDASCGQSDGSITINVNGGTAPYTFIWNSSPPQTTQTLSNVPPGIYCVTITDVNLCSVDTCYSISTGAFPATDICMVTVDTATNQNIIIWEKPVTTGINQYYIYRESSVGGIYNLIGSQSYSNFSTFTDTSSNSLQQPYRYKLAINDTCGFTSQLSNYHQTIHLTLYSSGGSWSLIWNNYEGFSFSTYNIYRGTNTGNMTLLNSVANTVNSYTDLAPPPGIVYYMIEAVKPTSCNPSLKSEDSFGSTISNIANTNEVGITEFSDEGNIQIYPNPGTGIFTILISCEINKSVSFEILNSLGQLVYSDIMDTNTKNIDVSKLSKGIYSIKLTIADKSYFEKIVIE